MERFVSEIVKVSLYMGCIVGAGAIAMGVVLWFWPEIIYLAAALSFVLCGLFLCGGIAYAIIKTKVSRN